MGCDGGTIPKRNELVKQKQKPPPKDKEAELNNLWRYCALSQEPLQEPIVMCEFGHLYNKTAILELLLNKNERPIENKQQHIKHLRDVRGLKLTKNREFLNSGVVKQNSFIDKTPAIYICPITRLEMNGKYRFVAPWSCGCVFSEKALKEINDSCCPCCSKVYQRIVVLNGDDADVEVMRLCKRRKLSC